LIRLGAPIGSETERTARPTGADAKRPSGPV